MRLLIAICCKTFGRYYILRLKEILPSSLLAYFSWAITVRPSMGEDVAFKFLANITWNFNLLLVLASPIQISCLFPSSLPLHHSLNTWCPCLRRLETFWHGNHQQTMKHFLFIYIESCQCVLDLGNPSQNCLNAPVLKGSIDTNVKNQWQQGWCHPNCLVPTWQALSTSRCMRIRFRLTCPEKELGGIQLKVVYLEPIYTYKLH